jgi:hypothetical protein
MNASRHAAYALVYAIAYVTGLRMRTVTVHSRAIYVAQVAIPAQGNHIHEEHAML